METPFFYPSARKHEKISILPIRDGNHVNQSTQYGFAKISILPIRDGNKLAEVLTGATPTNFDTSYKGWKPRKVPLLYTAVVHFDTSYKGWKLIFS